MNPARSAFPYSHSMGAFALTALLAVTATTASRSATSLVDDQFIDGAVTNGTDALDATWTSINAGLSVGAFDSSGNTTSALVKTGSATFNTVKGAFTNTTALTNGGDGASITLSFDFRFTATPGASNAGLRIGLGTSSNGYTFNVGTGGTASGGFVQYTAADATAGTSNGFTTSPASSFSISDTASHTFSLTLTRTGANSLSLSSTLDGNTFTATSGATSISAFTFDRILIGEGGTAMRFNIDNVNVTLGVIPEPSAYATFAGLGALGLVAFQRRRISR
jgi:hypothetical protein